VAETGPARLECDPEVHRRVVDVELVEHHLAEEVTTRPVDDRPVRPIGAGSDRLEMIRDRPTGKGRAGPGEPPRLRIVQPRPQAVQVGRTQRRQPKPFGTQGFQIREGSAVDGRCRHRSP